MTKVFSTVSSKQEQHPQTTALNKRQKNSSKKARSQALAWLAAEFPWIFDNTFHIYPLKIGIMDDILDHADRAEKAGISRSKLREALVLFTRRIDYLVCLKAREMRRDLMGNPTVQVTEAEAEKAASKIKRHVEKCARNARKIAYGKVSSTPALSSELNQTDLDYFHYEATSHYGEKPPLYATALTTKTSSPTIIKRKGSRPFDPDAVARLKEKLGLARNKDKLEEKV